MYMPGMFGKDPLKNMLSLLILKHKLVLSWHRLIDYVASEHPHSLVGVHVSGVHQVGTRIETTTIGDADSETLYFKLLIEYSRTRHACFLAEIFRCGTEYTICFGLP